MDVVTLLLVEDNPGDALLIEETLSEVAGTVFHAEHVERLAGAIERLRQRRYDAVLLDLGLPDSQGLATLAAVQAYAGAAPVVVLTGRDDETLALKALQAGAQDYLVKGQVFGTMLVRSVRHAIERVRTEQSLREAEERFRELADHVSSVYWLASADGSEVLFLNPAFERVTGRTRESLYADPGSSLRIVHEDDRPLLERRMAAVPDAWDDEYRIVRPDGEVRWVRDRGRPVRDAWGRTVRLAGLVEDVTDTRLAQEQIRLQAHLLDAVGESVIATHLDGTVFYWNRAAERLYGWSAAEAAGRTVMELIVPEISREEGERIMAALAVGESWHGEFLVRRRDGTTFPALVSDAPILDRDGRLIGIIGTSSDVTARKQAEVALRDSEARYRTLFETMAQGVVFIDPDGRVRSANPAAMEILGLSREAVLRLSIDHPRMRLLAEDGSRLAPGECPGTVALRNGRVEERVVGVFNAVEERLRWVLMHARPQLLPGETAPHGACVTFTDITAQRQAEADQRSARKKLDAILSTTPLATIVVDRAGNVRMWNPAAERLFGWTADEVVGRPYPLVPADGGPAPHAIFEDVYDGIVWNGQEVRRRTRDGRVLDLCLWNASLSGEDGEPVGLVGVFADITERKALEAQFLQSQKMEAVGRLAGGVAHDFNNLLTAITGHAGLLLEDAEEGTEQHADLVEIRRAAERAASLTGQLLAFSRKQVLRPQVLDINAVVAGTEAMLRRLIGEDIEMAIQCHARIPTVRADRGQVEQVLVNLVVNARDAMPTGGRLTIGTDAVVITPENAQAHPYGVQPGPYVRVTVADTGTGMPEEVASRVFEPFFTTKEVGTGLGLSTVYGIVKQSGGYIWVESEPAKGSTFRVYLPRVYDAVEAPAAVEESPVRAGRETILVVEDDHAVRALAVRILTSRGYRVLAAEDGMSALEQVAPGSEPVDLLLTDVVLPGISGPEVARAVVRTSPRTEVLFMSGYTDQALAAHGVREVGDRLLAKPFSPEQLARRVRLALDRAGTPAVARR